MMVTLCKLQNVSLLLFFQEQNYSGKSGDIYDDYNVDDADDDVGGDDLDDDLEEQEVKSEPLRAQLDHARSQK